MNQIFQQNGKNNTMTVPVMQGAIRHYIDQFDPNRIYLLDREVAPYQNLSDKELAKIIQEYQEDKYAIFSEMDALFQHSITRSRDIRAQIATDKSSLFQKNKVQKAAESFPKTFVELRSNIKNDIINSVNGQKSRFGETYIMKHPSKAIEAYETKAQDHEDQYLFVDKSGSPLPKAEQKSLFSMHILKAIARSLDANTDYLSPAEAHDMMVRLEKGYPGIGIVLQQRPKGIYISRLVEQGPAEKSGKIKMNDRLMKVDGVPVENQSIEEILNLLQGQKGSVVNLIVERKIKEEHRYVDKAIPVSLEREYIAVNEGRVESSFETMGNGIIGMVKLNSFYRGENGVTSENDMRKAVQDLDKKGNLRGLIIDLRENGGGYLTEAVKVAGLFITDGIIVTAKYSDGSDVVFRDVDKTDLFNGPIVILTSKATASAAEIVAQALQDYGVALVVGDEKTYGKGTIQNQTVTQDNGTSYYKVTVGKYYTVSGKTPDHTGVKADIVVPSQFSFLKFGKEVVSAPNDPIPPAFSDKLEGVPPESRDWYLRYYIPSLQPKTDIWRVLLPTLQKNSAYRISKNKDYQLFLKHSGAIQATPDDSDDDGESSHEKNYGMEDLQMAEAVNIVRDMIILHHRAGEMKMARAGQEERNLAESKK